MNAEGNDDCLSYAHKNSREMLLNESASLSQNKTALLFIWIT